MKKIIRLTEGDLVRLIKRVINEHDGIITYNPDLSMNLSTKKGQGTSKAIVSIGKTAGNQLKKYTSSTTSDDDSWGWMDKSQDVNSGTKTPVGIEDSKLLNNIKNELINLGFKYTPENNYGQIQHKFRYEKGENSITVRVDPQPSISKPYSVVSILLKPNYESNPGYEQSKWDMTYTDIDKNYSADQYRLLISDVKTSMNKIKPNA